jgi:hypothetical protein
MIRPAAIRSLFAVLAFLFVSGLCLARTWTDRKGRQIEADLIAVKDEAVRLKRTSDGKVFEIPLAGLSDADQVYARSQTNNETRADGGMHTGKQAREAEGKPEGYAAHVYSFLDKNADFKQLRAKGEKWQTDPIAFARLFFGADLELRTTNLGKRVGNDEVYKLVDAKEVIWPAVVQDDPLPTGRGNKPVLLAPISASGTVIIMDQAGLVSNLPLGTWVAAQFKINGPSSPFGGLGCCAMIGGNGTLLVIMMPKDLRIIPIQQLPEKWPRYDGELSGADEVRIVNPNAFEVRVGLRSEGKGKDFRVPPKGREAVAVPDGRYEVFFWYATDPEGVYQGDSFSLNKNGVEIQIVEVLDGNYGIRKLK